MQQHAGQISVLKQVLKDIQNLRMQQGRLRKFPSSRRSSQHKNSRANDCTDPQRRE